MAEKAATATRAIIITAIRKATTATIKGVALILLVSDQTLVAEIVTKRQRVLATTTRVRSRELGATGTKTAITITTRGDALLYRRKKKYQKKRLRGVKNVQIASASESIVRFWLRRSTEILFNTLYFYCIGMYLATGVLSNEKR